MICGKCRFQIIARRAEAAGGAQTVRQSVQSRQRVGPVHPAHVPEADHAALIMILSPREYDAAFVGRHLEELVAVHPGGSMMLVTPHA